MKEKTVNIDNHIGVYDNYITREECNRAIQLLFDGLNWQVVAGEITGDAEMVIA